MGLGGFSFNPQSLVRRGIFLPSLVFLHLALLLLPAIKNSPTADEVVFLTAGVHHWQTGTFDLCVINPPLVRLASSIPVVCLRPETDWSELNLDPYSRGDIPASRQFVHLNRDRLRQFLFLFRISCLPFSAIGLIICFRWAGEISGVASANFVGLLWCFSPLVLGHGSLATADVPASSLFVATMYFFRRWLLQSDLLNAIKFGLLLGLTMSTKFLFFPLMPFIVPVAYLVWRGKERCTGIRVFRDIIQLLFAASIAIFLINAIYCFDRTGICLGDLRAVKLVSQLLQYCIPTSLNGVADNIPAPLPYLYIVGMDAVGKELQPQGEQALSYLMGEWKHGGWWYYYVVGVLTKEPVSAIVLFITGMLNVLLKFKNLMVPERLFLLIPLCAILSFVSLQTGFNRHLRYILPAYPFAYILLAVYAASLGRSLMVGFATAFVLSSLWITPHWLSYYNEFALGCNNGGYWLLGTNTDLGQDLYRLKDAIASREELSLIKGKLHCPRYNQSDLGIAIQEPPPVEPGRPDVVDSDGKRGPQPGWFAVSVRVLRAAPHSEYSGFQYFRQFEPKMRIGYTINIYHLSNQDVERYKGMFGETK